MPSVANGFLFDDDGNLEMSSGPIVSWNGGLPFDADGRLVGTTAAPSDHDPYVGGVRVSSTLGVCVEFDTPPPVDSGFSTGFSTGFGAP